MISAHNWSPLSFCRPPLSLFSSPSCQLYLCRRSRISIDGCFRYTWNLSYQSLEKFCLNWDSFCWILHYCVQLQIEPHFFILFCPKFCEKGPLFHCLKLKFTDCSAFIQLEFSVWAVRGFAQEFLSLLSDRRLIFSGCCNWISTIITDWGYPTFLGTPRYRLIWLFPKNLHTFSDRQPEFDTSSDSSSTLKFIFPNLPNPKRTFDGFFLLSIGLLFLSKSLFCFFSFRLILLQKLAKGCKFALKIFIFLFQIVLSSFEFYLLTEWKRTYFLNSSFFD